MVVYIVCHMQHKDFSYVRIINVFSDQGKACEFAAKHNCKCCLKDQFVVLPVVVN